jgi:serine/threonine protein kinase
MPCQLVESLAESWDTPDHLKYHKNVSTSSVMSVHPSQVEEAILRAVAAVRVDEWVQYSFGDLRNRLSEVDARVGNENINLIIDALVALGVQGYLELGKFEAEQRLAFDFNRQRDGRYLNQFFAVNPFDLRLTHEGRKRITQPTELRRSGEFPTTLRDVRSEIDYWARIQGQAQPGSVLYVQVTDRLVHLRNLEQRFASEQPSRKHTNVCVGGFGKYTLGTSIGNGGAGIVFEAQTDENVTCAVKILAVTQELKIKRFKNEVFFCLRNQHRNVISVLDYGQTTDGRLFYVMPLYGSTLRKLISTGIEPGEILDLFSQILDGVEAAHLSGVCHRDLKPENILWDQTTKTLIVADGGIARFKEEDLQTAVETSDQERLANFLYSAPEQRVKGKTVDQRADIYALGLILNEMFTGDVPQGTGFRRISTVAQVFRHLDAVVDSMVQQDSNNRPPSIEHIRQPLRLNRPMQAKANISNLEPQTEGMSDEDRDKVFEEADVDFEITQGMQQNFIIHFNNRSATKIIVKKFKLSHNGIKIVEAPPREKGPWQLEAMRSQDFWWEANPDPVVSLMQIQGEWNKPFNVTLQVFMQIEVFGRIKTFADRSIFCQVEPSSRRIWHKL